MRLVVLARLGACGLAIFCLVRGQSFSGVEVIVPRDDTEITVRNLDEGEAARTYLNNKNCKEGFSTSIFYGPAEGFVNTLSEDAVLTSSVVFIETPEGEGGEERERVELFNAELTFNRPRCAEEITPQPGEKVRLEQGRTTVEGDSFVLEPKEDIGTMSGPVSLNRAADGDSPALQATSETLRYNFDTEKSVLTGGVQVTSEDRISEAEELEYDEENSVAVMRGSPARSTQGTDVVEGDTIIYYLDLNDVLVKGSVEATLEIDLGGGLGTANFGGSDTGSPAPSGEPDDTFGDDFADEPGEFEPPPAGECDAKNSSEPCDF